MRPNGPQRAGAAPPIREWMEFRYRSKLSRGEGAMRELEHFQNLVEMFFRRASRKQDAPFLSVKQEGRWRALSWEETAGQVGRLAVGLRRLGLHAGDRVMLVSEN